MSSIPAAISFAGHTLDFQRPQVMGILNVTPDSFSDGGSHYSLESALAAAERMIAAGADIIDVGGESTRPGAPDVSEAEELDRTATLVEKLVQAGTCVSVDTSKAAVMQACLSVGAFMINDVRALQEPDAVTVVAEFQAPVCLMHMQGQPRSMQNDPHYDDVVTEVREFLAVRQHVCVQAGIAASNIMLDPGFGFGKNLQHNLCLLRELSALQSLGSPLLVGLSRKSMFGAMLDLPVDQRLHASIAAALLAVERGANCVRVHDVKATVHALGVYNAMTSA